MRYQMMLEVLPDPLRQIIGKAAAGREEQLEEIRIREGRPLEVIFHHTHGFVTQDGEVVAEPKAAYRPSAFDCTQLLDLLSNHSMYTLEEELRRGFITIRGGHRVGLAGRVALEKGKVAQIREISSFNLRMAKEVTGAGTSLLTHLVDPANCTLHHTLIISPPQWGKTTLIRDLCRMLSYGRWPDAYWQWPALKIGIVDERSELAACYKGVPTFDVGPRTDVLDGCPKAEGMMMMIRSMSPHVLVVDEIGRSEDAQALQDAIHAGIRVMATAHGRDVQSVKSRPALSGLFDSHVFERYVVLGTADERGYNGQAVVFDHAERRLAVLPWRTAGNKLVPRKSTGATATIGRRG